jgi:hypothetical protein
MNNPQATWWIWNLTCQRLSKWALALLHGRRYTIRLVPEGTGCHDPLGMVIQVNPQLFPGQSVEVQFRLTQGLLAHECGHAWFTGSWPDQSDNALQQLTNMLEDERIERGICQLYPGVAPAIRLLGDLVYTEMGEIPEEASLQAFMCCLAWRWAHSRTTELEMFTRLRICPAGQCLWREIRPIVEQAWMAQDTTAVIALAREILDQLDLPLSAPPLDVPQINPHEIPRSPIRSLPLPRKPSVVGPGLGENLADRDLPALPPSRRNLIPAPYLELEKKVLPHAMRLAGALLEPRPDQRFNPHEYRGRYSFRQEVRTPERPHLALQDPGQAARSLAFYILVDRSGSMLRFELAVREALMTIFLAALQVAIPTGIAYFGEEDLSSDGAPLPVDRISIEQTVVEIAPFSAQDPEPAKALIAGYSGWSSQEYLDWGLRKAEQELRGRSERLRVLLVLHDGEPVFKAGSLSDWDLSLAHLRSLEHAGIMPIGIHLGHEKVNKLRKLFPRLVCCPEGNGLADKLGSLLCSLA